MWSVATALVRLDIEMKNKARLRKNTKSNTHSTCRTCLSSEALRPLFPVKSKHLSFERVLSVCTGLQIKMDDGLTQKICKNCAKFIESVIQFRKRSHASQAKLIKCLENKKKPIRSNLKTNSIERRLEKMVDNNESNSVRSALKSTSIGSSEEDADPVEIIVPTQKIAINIKPMAESQMSYEDDHAYCNADTTFNHVNPVSFNSDSDNEWFGDESLDQVLKTPAKIISSGFNHLNYIETSDNPMKAKCKICQLILGDICAKGHVKRHLFGYLCEFCGKVERTLKGLARHLQAKHGLARGNRFPCSHCDYRALDREMLEVHERRIHTKERPFVCDYCGDAFYTKRVLRQHFVTHMTKRAFKCEQCGKNYKSKAMLVSHIVRTHKPRKYEYGCPYCLKTCTCSGESRKHIEKVHHIPKKQQGKVPRFNL